MFEKILDFIYWIILKIKMLFLKLLRRIIEKKDIIDMYLHVILILKKQRYFWNIKDFILKCEVWFLIHKKLIIYFSCFIGWFFVITLICNLNLQYKYNKLNNKYIDIVIRNSNLEKDLRFEKKQRKIEIKMISEKVDTLYEFVKRSYPYFEYDYKTKINDAINNSEKIKDLPDDLFSIYVKEKFIKPHGLENYQMTLKDMGFPLEKNSCFTTCKNSEYGAKRPYAYYGYKHEGIDLYTFYNYSVYAVYDSTVYKVYYEEGGGWTIELKFKYRLQDGNQGFYFVRYRHLQEIMVKVGDIVKKGEIIASMGTTGTFSSGIHLHFELWRFNGQRYINLNPVLNSTWQNKVIPRLFY